MTFPRAALVAASCLAVASAATAQEKPDPAKQTPAGTQPAQPTQPRPPRAAGKTWDQVVDAGVAYLKSAQADDGSWGKAVHPGISGVVLTSLFKTGKVAADDPMAAKGLKYVETMVDEKAGHIAAGENIRHKFYTTSVNAQALKASGLKKYEPTVAAAAAYFKKGQGGADDGKSHEDTDYGGFGYAPGARGDVSNTHFALDFLKAAGVPADDPVFKRALVFVSRMQNLKGEHNDRPWAGAVDDGSFMYSGPAPAVAGAKEPPPPADAPRPGYGSMTYAGLKCLVWCGAAADDPRRKKAMEWVAKNYSVDVNPGRQEGAGGQGYYYYLVSMARCLDALGVDEVKDAAGKSHDWRAEITRALTNRQKKDGSWGSDFGQWMEGDTTLDTAYALIALGYTKPKPVK